MPRRLIPTSSFTARADHLANALLTEVQIGNNQALTEEPTVRQYKAIWDTGATGTSVTKRVATECSLTPISQAAVTGVHDTQLSNVYLIDVRLPNRVVVSEVRAVETPLLAGEAEVLIGMDIIGMGDFAVSNFQGKTTFTFRMPSQEEITFVPAPPKVGRNDPCPCGSGKKYKKCHGS